MLINIAIDSLFAGIASVGFAVLFNVPKGTLPFCALTSFLGYATRLVLLHVTVSTVVATFFASAVIGVIAVIWSRKFSVPRSAYTVAAIIPMFPGKYAFLTIIGLAQMTSGGVTPGLTTSVIQNALTTISIVGAISLGVVVPSLYYIRHNQPVI
ncbi:MAG: threonine/serine exporter [Desulforhopalus sp.]|nr:threonine/serine exporter [Desulforhopalus sp.]